MGTSLAEVEDRSTITTVLVRANTTHGYPRSNDDKRQAVMTLLRDAEWSQWSDREIARRCAVTHPFVATVRASLVTVRTRRGISASSRILASGFIRQSSAFQV
jgi:hypothetical protein